MRKVAAVVAVLLGLVFVASGLVVLLKIAPTPPPPPEGSPAAGFFAAFGPTGYLTFVKVLEVIGGILLAVPDHHQHPGVSWVCDERRRPCFSGVTCDLRSNIVSGVGRTGGVRGFSLWKSEERDHCAHATDGCRRTDLKLVQFEV